MEDSIVKHEGPSVSKRSRSLDAHGWCQEQSCGSSGKLRSENGCSLKRRRRDRSGGRSFSGNSRRCKSKSKISITSSNAAVKKQNVSTDISLVKSDVGVTGTETPQQPLSNGSSSVLHDVNGLSSISHTSSDQSVVQKEDKSVIHAENAQDLSSLANGFVVPKRPRGASRRKKASYCSLADGTVPGVSSCNHTNNNDAPSSMLSVDSVTTPHVSMVENKKVLSEHKESEPNSLKREVLAEVPTNEEEETPLGKIIRSKVVRNHRKRRYSTSEGHVDLENGTLYFQKSSESFEDTHDDEEENLEENAARMLSSRFDPSCTGFSGNKTPPKPVHGCAAYAESFCADSGVLDSRSSSFDASRILRPRRGKDRNSVRKRRHFYEVHAKDMDPHWVLKRRIRIFWPLDEVWYFGLVTDYNPVTCLHHVKYDDREEEWVNLQNERFKLLMFPSEFTGKLGKQEHNSDCGQKTVEVGENASDDKDKSHFTESEPIISWLARSTHRLKLSPLNILKEKGSRLRKHLTSSLLGKEEQRNVHSLAAVHLNRNTRSTAPHPVSEGVKHASVVKGEEDIFDRRFSFFYSRKRFRRSRKLFNNVVAENPIERSFGTYGISGPLELDLTLKTVKLKLGSSDWRILVPQYHKSQLVEENIWLCGRFVLLHYGRLITTFPKVCMKVFFLDNITGLKIVSYEGDLRHAVALVSLILRIFYSSGERRKPVGMQMPVTSIGFEFSGLQRRGRHILIAMQYFLELDSSKWTNLNHTLKENCLLTSEVPISECTLTDIRDLLERNDLMSCIEDVDSNLLVKRHLKFLLKNEACSIGSENQRALPALAYQEKSCKMVMAAGCSITDDSSCLEGISSLDKGADAPCSSPTYVKHESFEEEDQVLEWEDKAVSTSNHIHKVNGSSLQDSSLRFRPREPQNGLTSVLSPFGFQSQMQSEDFIRDGFVGGYRKPRTRVSYSSPIGGHPPGTDSCRGQKGHPYKKMRTDNSKKIAMGSGPPQRNISSMVCEANVLVTDCDRGWREHCAQVVLDCDDQDWKILVKLSGVTKYSYKAQQFLQPGSTNRFTHAMMWKGGKNWTLEFSDRSHWALFKEMHEECYNRNLRAASIKNIPIPGVWLIEDVTDSTVEVPFVPSFPRYFRQIGTEVDMAMDPSRVIYDLDSDDEEWISKRRSSADNDGNTFAEIPDDMFEKAIDMLEKFAFAQQCDEFTDSEIESYMEEIVPLDVVKSIHEYWFAKRQKKGLPLIQQFQPPLWVQYHKKLKEWESTMSKLTNSNGSQGNGLLAGKPPMFAFCLKPRGLDAPNKGSKQRSHKKFAVGHHSMPREHDSLQNFGRKTNGYSAGDEKALFMVPNQEVSDSGIWVQSPTGFSPRDTANTFMAMSRPDRKYMKLQRNFRRVGTFPSHRNFHIASGSNGQRRRIESPRRNNGFADWTSGKQIQSDGFQQHHADIEEFRLRDASSAAQHASNMAKLKREKAQWLLHKADLALHKAMVALMTAEAMKASEDGFIDEG